MLKTDHTIAIIYTVVAAWKILLLVVKETSKAGILKLQYAEYPPEMKSWLLNRATFWWMNSLFFKGFKSLLSLRDLSSLKYLLLLMLFSRNVAVLPYYVSLVPWH
jgi:hypothetical protein